MGRTLMPISLPPINRRRFLAGSAAALATARLGWADESTDYNEPIRWALLSDTHINQNPTERFNDVNMTDHLKAVMAEVAAQAESLAGVIINGDCAHVHGNLGDYRAFIELLKPLREAGLTIHCSLGNHDHRERFFEAAVEPRPKNWPVHDKYVTILETPNVNLFVLDSLAKTANTPGTLGEAQLEWLAKSLDTRASKPAIVIGHHNPQPPLLEKQFGLTDTAPFLKLLNSRKHVHGYLHGHSHRWGFLKQEGVRLVQLPSTAYVFSKGEPSGWTLATLDKQSVTFQLHALDKKHPWNGQKLSIDWRV